MKSKHFLAMAVVGGLSMAVVLGAGCGSSTSTGGVGGSGTTASVSSSKTSSTIATTGTGGMGAGGGGGGPTTGTNHAAGMATPLTVGDGVGVTQNLVDPMTPDYYSFAGTKGDRLIITAQSEALAVAADPTALPSDETVTDTVVVLYNPDMTTIWASDDDQWPRVDSDSQLFTELPATGTYYIAVMDCNAYSKIVGGIMCATAANITNFTYQVEVSKVAETKGATTAVPVTYKAGTTAGTYDEQLLGGDFATATDKHIFAFTPPANTMVDPTARSRAYFWVQPITGKDGTGSLSNVLLTAKDSTGTIIAQSDQKNYKDGDNADTPLQFSFPFTAGSAYTLEVTNEALTYDPTTNYYFMLHYVGPYDFGQTELEPPSCTTPPCTGTNDTGATAETVNFAKGVSTAYFVDGNLSSPSDVDWYKMTVPAKTTKIAEFDCSSARDGAGVTGFKAQLWKDVAGTMALEAIGPEVLTAPLSDVTANVVGTGVTTLWLQVTSTGASTATPPNTGTSYACQMYFE